MAEKDSKKRTKPLVSSAIATGGGGTHFEVHVNASFLALALVGAIPPVLTDCVLEEVWFQTEHLGWETDDLLLVGLKADGTKRHYAGQVKRSFKVSKGNDDCVGAFTDYWKDFHNAELFAEGTDQLGLLLLAGNDSAAVSLRALCDCARASKDASDFEHRLKTDGFLNAKVRDNAKAIEEIVTAVPDITFDADKFWRFLKSLHIQSLDLNTSTSHTEALIKSLLALSATGRDKSGEADLTWGELLQMVMAGMPAAQANTRNSLPEALRTRHGAIPTAISDALEKAKEHSRTTLKGIRTEIGNGVALRRDDVVATLLEDISESPLVLVAGPAGSGKSAVTKLAVQHLAATSIVLAFRAEEFAVVHLDQALLQAQIPANAAVLGALLAGQGRKILLIESVERLLEANSRNAFHDLLTMCAADQTWQVILTCRDYSVDIVRSALLEPFGANPAILRTPPLTNDELDAVVEAIPSLKRPATHEFLRELFRNPYILDKAARMQWPENGTLPNDERAFRKKFWQDIVRRDGNTDRGMPRRRHEAFIELCLRRARALEPFAPCNDFDAEVLIQLRSDSLVDVSPVTDALGAPAHDVLEDWAVVEWISERFAVQSSNRKAFADELGTYPAIRRAYRKWLGETVVENPANADAYVLGVVSDESLPAHFKDDTLIAILKSTAGGDFVTRNHSLLAANNGVLLRRVIHLVRVACKTTPAWATVVEPTWFVPDGPSWAAALKAVHKELSLFLPREVGLIAGLLKDWASGIAYWLPTPEGAEDAATIAFKLLPHVDRYDHKDQLKQILEVILKIPNGNKDEFQSLVTRALARDRSDHAATEFTEMIVGISGTYACRDVPDAVIQLAEATIIWPKSERARDFHRSVEVDTSFGIREHLEQDFFPTSSMQGPFRALLRNHPVKAVHFIMRLLNHAGESYADPDINRQLEEPWEVELTLPDGSTKKYWCNPRLWNLYREFSVGPHVIQCALMALEEYLLEASESDAFKLELWLTYLLKESNNVAVLAVAASVALAYPKRVGRAGLALLTSKDVIRMDFARAVHELHPRLELPNFKVMHKLFEQERIKSHNRRHRRSSLEILALHLQTSELKDETQALLDKYKAQLPPLEAQSQDDKYWRIALHRMDIRVFRVQEPSPTPSDTPASTESDKPTDGMVCFSPGPLEPDLEEMVNEETPEHNHSVAITSLYLWGDQAYRREPDSGKDWQEKLSLAKVPATEDDIRWEGDSWAFKAPISIAAVCVRDHWTELSVDDKSWCINTLIAAVVQDADVTSLFPTGTSDVAKRAAFILSLILNCDVGTTVEQEILKALLVACTHADSKVIISAASGIGRHLYKTRPQVVLGFLGLFARFSVRLAELDAEEQKLAYKERRASRDVQQAVKQEMRVFEHWTLPCTKEELSAVPNTNWFASHCYHAIMAILFPCTGELLALQGFEQIAAMLAKAWDKERRGRGERNFHFESECEDYLAYFSQKLPAQQAIELLKPLLSRVATCPKEAGSFFEKLTAAEDNAESTSSFWPLWNEFADRVLKSPWLEHLEERYPPDYGLLKAMFFSLPWKENVSHWHCLEGHSQEVGDFFAKLPPVAASFNAYLRFLHDIGEQSLPQAFVLLELRLRAGNAIAALSDSTVVFYFETILKRFVYGKPDCLKQDNALRKAVLYLLDQLVDAGSSTAYRMRDDFVTPGPKPGS